MTAREAAEEAGEPVPVRWVRLVARRWWVGSGTALVVLVATAAVLLLSRPVWRGEARLRLSEPPPPPSVSPSGGLFSILRPGGDPFANDLELLGSRTVAEDVTEALALDARMDAPRGWYRDSLFLALESTRATDEGVFELTWGSGGRVRVDRLEPAARADVARGSVGARLAFGGLVVVPAPRRSGAPATVRIRTIPFAEAADRFRGALDFERSRRDAYVLDVSFDHPDPGVAEAAVEVAIARFVEVRGELYGRESGTTTDSLRVVVKQTAAELALAEAALEALQRESGLVAPEAQAEAYVGRWVEVQADLEAARAELALVEAALDRTAEARAPVEAWTGLLSHPGFLENQTLGELLARLVELEEERVALASRRAPESREYRVLDEQVRVLDASLRSLARNHARSLRAAVEEMEAREERLAARLAELPEAAIDVGRRQRDVRLLSEVLVTTEGRLRQEEVRRALSYANVQVVDPPALVFEPVWPREKLGAAVGLLLALGTGLLAMVVVDRADTRIRRAAEVRNLTGAPLLATPAVGRRADLAPAEAEILRRAVPGAADTGVVVCGLEGRDDAEAVARVFGAHPGGPTALRTLGPVATPEDVAPALGGSRRVVLVVRYGRTDRRVLRRTVELFREAGGRIVGSVLLCGSRSEAEAAWS